MLNGEDCKMEIGDYRQDRTDTIAANLLQAFERFTTKDEK